jgi:hypothetical protein
VSTTADRPAVAFIFASPLIAAVILIEATGVGGAMLPMIRVPGLLGAGIGSLVATGMGSFTGLSTSAFALGPLQLAHFGHPDIAQFGPGIDWVFIVLAFLIDLSSYAGGRLAQAARG